MTTQGRETGTHIQNRLIDLGRQVGYYGYHTKDSRFSEPGVPDLILVHPYQHVQLVFECKGENEPLISYRIAPRTGRYLPGQQDWLDAFAQVKVVKSLLVRPSNEAEARAMILEAVGMKALE